MNEIYHDESLGVHINVVLVRMIMLGYAKVKYLTICELWTTKSGLANRLVYWSYSRYVSRRPQLLWIEKRKLPQWMEISNLDNEWFLCWCHLMCLSLSNGVGDNYPDFRYDNIMKKEDFLNSEGQGSLACYSSLGSQRVRHNFSTEQPPPVLNL